MSGTDRKHLLQAFDVLTTYLTDSEIAPLAKEFIEISTPACTSIDFYSEDRASAAELTCSISGVPYAKLDTIAGEVMAFLRKLADKEDIDMERLSSVIRRDRRKLLAQAESSVTGVLTNAIVSGEFFCRHRCKARLMSSWTIHRFLVLGCRREGFETIFR